jgi:hypothetical protein
LTQRFRWTKRKEEEEEEEEEEEGIDKFVLHL